MRSFRSITLFFFVCITLISAAPKADDPDAVLGKWLSSKKRNQVLIYKQGDKYYGKIVWMLEPNDPATKKPKLDVENPDEKLRQHPLVNLIVLKNLTYQGNRVWGGGEVYNPEDGKTYNCDVILKDANNLDIHGYIMGISFLGRTRTWTRVK
ncbi:DUF2147 domain-containing protein [Spirosoma sp. KNUC1025]|uniref:DUF2147 domain-containing protein n=1 Tax=Spirosoma sp. KNUC1025 TaxID=2894082 RepID=UPI00386A74E3|nr:DUF2147 domain-containing protein [Spirosoma sp. KNUC1025]